MPQLLFGGVLAVLVLGLYGYSVYEAVDLARECKDDKGNDIVGCTRELSGNLTLFFNVIGGLISAVVVGVLGSTNRGDLPAKEAFEKNLKGYTAIIAGYMPSFFILFWIICGVYMILCGFLTFNIDPVPSLTVQTKAWIGTAIGAVYAYFGIKPDPPKP